MSDIKTIVLRTVPEVEMPRDIKMARDFFFSIGFSVVHMEQDDFYLLVPLDPIENRVYGKPCFSARVMQAINDNLSKGVRPN